MKSTRVYGRKGIVQLDEHQRTIKVRTIFSTEAKLTLPQARELLFNLAHAVSRLETREDKRRCSES